MRQLIKTLIAITFFVNAVGQENGIVFKDTTYVTFKMGQSSTNDFTKGEPFQFLATFPKNDTIDNSWVLNSYAELAWNSDKTGTSVGIVAEIQKNTLIEKAQDVRQFGITFSQDIRDLFTYEVDGEKFKGATEGVMTLSGSIKSSKDRIAKKNSMQGHLGFSYSSYTNRNTWLSSDIFYPSFEKGSLGRVILFNHSYNFGLGYLGGEEKVLFGKADFQISAYLLGGLMCQTVQQFDFLKVKYSISARATLSGTPTLEQNPLRVLSAGINYKLNETNAIEISYNWNKGADPFTSLANQSYETITIKLKIALNNGIENSIKKQQKKNLLNNCGMK